MSSNYPGIKASIYNLFQNDDDLPTEAIPYLNDNILSKETKTDIIYWSSQRNTIYFDINFETLFAYVWRRIVQHESSDTIKEILNQEMRDGHGLSFVGIVVRLLNCLSGFYDDINLYITDADHINKIIAKVKHELEQHNKYTLENHKKIVGYRLFDMEYPENIINNSVNMIK